MNAREFFYRMGKTVYRIDRAYDEYGKGCNAFSSGELWILYALNDGSEHSQRQIAADWSIPRTSVNFVIKDLEAKGYVELVQIPGKRREMHVRLTESGKRYADSILNDLYRKEGEIFGSLKESEKFLADLEALAVKLSLMNGET